MPKEGSTLALWGPHHPKAVRELVLTVVLLSVPGLSAPRKTGGLHSSLLNSLGSRGSVLSREAHG